MRNDKYQNDSISIDICACCNLRTGVSDGDTEGMKIVLWNLSEYVHVCRFLLLSYCNV